MRYYFLIWYQWRIKIFFSCFIHNKCFFIHKYRSQMYKNIVHLSDLILYFFIYYSKSKCVQSFTQSLFIYWKLLRDKGTVRRGRVGGMWFRSGSFSRYSLLVMWRKPQNFEFPMPLVGTLGWLLTIMPCPISDYPFLCPLWHTVDVSVLDSVILVSEKKKL
jgi:hypothetical protein